MEVEVGRRRSFVDIQRKSLLFDQMFEEDRDNISSKENLSVTMKQYLGLLKEERKQWIDVLELRKKQLEEQRRQVSATEKNEITVSELETYLNEEDKKFLDEEPDYLGMLEFADKYLKALDFLKRYKSDIIEHYQQIIEETEFENDIFVQNLCQKDICELCNQINCNNPDHK